MKLWIPDINDQCPDFEKAFNNRHKKIVIGEKQFINWNGDLIDLNKQRLPNGVM